MELLAGAGAGTRGYDVVFEVCGAVAAVRQALELVRPGGVVVLIGLVHPQSDLAGITAEAIIRKHATIIGIHNYAPEDLHAAVAFLDETVDALPYAELTSPPHRLEDLPAALRFAQTAAYPRVLVVP